MAYSKIRDVRLYFKWLDSALKSGDITNPKELENMVEYSYDENGKIQEWIIRRQQVCFHSGESLFCCEEGEEVGMMGHIIPKYGFHFQPGSENEDMEVFRLDLDRGEEAHFNPSEARRASGDHIKNGQTPFDFSNFNCRLALLMSMVYLRTKVYPLDDAEQRVYEPVLSRKKDG